MGTVSVQALMCSMLAVAAAAIHGYTFALRRKEPAHLWLAFSALGIVGIAATTALVYEAASAAEAELWQRCMLAAAAPVLFGFHRFTLSLLELKRSRVDRALAVTAGILVVQVFWPHLVFGGVEFERHVPLLDLHYYSHELAGAGIAMVAGFGVYGAHVARLWFVHRQKLRDGRRLMLVLFVFLIASGTNDLLVGMRVYDGLLLVVYGYVAFLAALSSLLLRRLVLSMDEVERSAEELQEEVTARTEELRQKDLQLAHGDRMATIGTLAAGIAHEINNPIAFVSSNLNQLENFAKEADQGEATEILLECREGVDRVGSIVANLLSMARRSDGIDGPVDLREVVRSAMAMLAHEARYRTRLETELEDVPPVLGDARLLGQVVVNLVINAIQAIPEGEPESHRVSVFTRCENGAVQLVVRDTGPGIPDELVPRIFDPFFTTKPQGQGTGLGLAVTHQLVTRYRGTIDVETGATGTTITVALPVAPRAEPAA